jgi:hypothetical protein
VANCQDVLSATPTNPGIASAALAPAALTDVDVELAMNGPARNLHLELLGDVGFVEGAAAFGANVGQVRLVDFIDQFWGRWLAVGLGAITLARLAAGFARIRLGLAIGKRAGLALAGTEGRVGLMAEPIVLGLEVVDPSPKGLAVGTPERFHARIIRSSQTCSCADDRRIMVRLELRR